MFWRGAIVYDNLRAHHNTRFVPVSIGRFVDVRAQSTRVEPTRSSRAAALPYHVVYGRWCHPPPRPHDSPSCVAADT